MIQLNFSSYSTLTTERLLLRFPTLKDTQAVFDLRSNDIINRYIDSRKVPQTISDAEAFINMISENISANKNLFWLMELKSTNQVIGAVSYHSFSEDFKYGEIGYEVHPDFHRKGYMKEAFQKVIDFGFQKLKLETIEAFTHKNNEASKSLLAKHKFIHLPERVDERVENNSIFQLKLSDYTISC